MKRLCNVLLYLCFFSISSSLFAQVLWSEDFESYVVGTGYVGSSSPTAALVSGDYPSLVTKWTIDTAAAKLTASTDWLSVQEDDFGNKTFEIRDADGEFIWYSETIDISGYLDIIMSVSVTEVSNLESTDYINVFYKLDGAAEVLFQTNGSNSNDFTSSKAVQENVIGSSVQIIIRAKNNSGTEHIRFDDIFVTEKSLLITEVSDPLDNSLARFIEIQNCSNHTIDFSLQSYYLSIQIDGSSWSDLQLTGALCANCVNLYALSSSDFNSAYNYAPPQTNAIINGNGNDAYYLFYNGNHSTGSVVDAYGLLNQNGTGQVWEYTDSRAIRSADALVGTTKWNASEWLIYASSIADMTPGALESELRFYSSVWHPKTVSPTSLSDELNVVVQADSVVITENMDCSNLSIFEDAILDLNTHCGITVSGNCINNGILKVQSNTISNGSLIVNGSMTNTIDYNLYLSGGATSPWHLISSPVQTQSINTFVTNTDNSIPTSANNNYGLAVFNTTSAAWNYFHNGAGYTPNVQASTAGDFENAKGYSVLRSSSGTVNFSGSMNTSDQNIALTASKWNLIGNPYPSFVHVNTAASENDNILSSSTAALNDKYEAIYLWNSTSDSYDIINHASSATFLSPGQGFYVLADANGGGFSFTESMQSHQADDWFERSFDYPTLKVNASTITGTGSTEIKLIENTTLGFDLGYDAARFDGLESDFYIFSQLVDGSNDSNNLGIQCFSPLNITSPISIPLGVFINNDELVEFNFELIGLSPTSSMYLIDNVLDSLINLKEQTTYSAFMSVEEPVVGRFFILANDSLNSVSVEVLSDIKLTVYVVDEFLYVAGAVESVDLKIYDTLGRLVKEEELHYSECDISVLVSGLYFVIIEYKNQLIKHLIII